MADSIALILKWDRTGTYDSRLYLFQKFPLTGAGGVETTPPPPLEPQSNCFSCPLYTNDLGCWTLIAFLWRVRSPPLPADSSEESECRSWRPFEGLVSMIRPALRRLMLCGILHWPKVSRINWNPFRRGRYTIILGQPYSQALTSLGMNTFWLGRKEICRKFLQTFRTPPPKLNYLLPELNSTPYTLRGTSRLPRSITKHARHRDSFIPFALATGSAQLKTY